MYFLYTIDEWADEPVMLINKHIGLDAEEGMGIMGDQFQEELLALDSGRYGVKQCIKVYINSAGGRIGDGMNIYSAIVKSTTPVDTYCVGMVASTAGGYSRRDGSG